MKKITLDDPCEGCEGLETSSCCGASIIWGDICNDCKEHCDTQCADCETNPNKL